MNRIEQRFYVEIVAEIIRGNETGEFKLPLIYELMLIMDQLFLILMSEYNTEDKISREFDPGTMDGLSE